MLETLKAFDESLLVYLNSMHNSFFDQAMWLFSNKLFWAPLYAWFLWLLYKIFPDHYWTVLITVVLLIVASDQLCNFSKVNVMRLRPSQEPHLKEVIHIVNNYRGGTYGFYSGHASNAFAVAAFLIMSAGKLNRYLIAIALIYASLTAYSRIYLGVHYPGDILVGTLMGAILGTAFAAAHKNIRNKYMKTVKP